MSKKSREIIAEAIAEELSVEMLSQEKEKTRDTTTEQIISNELSERYQCPKCDNELMKDERNNELYCPTGHHSHEL